MSTTAHALLTNGQAVNTDALTPRKERRSRWECLEAARIRLGIQKKEIAHCWDCSHVYVSRVLSGVDPLPDARVHQLPSTLQEAMFEEEGVDLDLLVGAKAVAISLMVGALTLLRDERSAPLRMAKATLDTQRAERKRA